VPTRSVVRASSWARSRTTSAAEALALTEPEARLALTNAGYEAGQDGLWRPSDTEEGRQRRKGLEEIERRAYADMEEEWVGRPSREDESDDDDQ
jgi:hypothetical protein